MNIRELVTRIGFTVDERGLAIYDHAIGRIYQKTDALYQNLQRSADSIAAFGRGLTFKMSLPLAIYSGFAVKAAADTEGLITRYGVLLQDVEAGKKLFEDLRRFEAFTPLDLKNVTQGADLLLGVGGVAKEKVIPVLQMLSDIAGKDAARFQTLVLNYSQILSNQRLMGEDARRFGEAGINLYAELGKETGKTTAELRKMGEQGEITGDMVTRVLQRMTSEGGKFYKGSEKASQSLGGLFSTLASAFQKLNAEVGAMIVEFFKIKPIIRWLGNTVSKLADNLRTAPKWMKAIAVGIGALMIVIPPLIWALGSLGSALLGVMISAVGFKMAFGVSLLSVLTKAGMAVKAFTVALMTNPWTAVIIAALTLLWLFIDDFMVWMKGGNSVLGAMFGDFPTFIKKVKDVLSDVLGRFSGAFDALKQGWKGLWHVLLGTLRFVFGLLTGDFDMMVGGFKEAIKGLIDYIIAIFRWPAELAMGIIENIKAVAGWLGAPARTSGSDPTGFGGKPAPADYGFSMLTPAESDRAASVGAVTVQNTVQVTPPAGSSPAEVGESVSEALKRETGRSIEDIFGFATN